LLPGDRRFIGLTVKNTGNTTWTNTGSNPINLGTSNPYERISQFYDSTWLSKTRPTTLKEASVAPGETGTFEFWITAPYVTSTTKFNEYFTPLAEGKTWLPNIGLYFGFTVQKPTYTWSLTSQYAYTDDTKTTQAYMGSLRAGQKVYVGFTAKNTGNMTWLNSGPHALMVGAVSPLERSSVFAAGSNWLAKTRPALMKEASVAPGQTATFEFWLTVPAYGVSGVYNERFGLIANELTWLNDVGLSYYMNIEAPKYTWSVASQYAFTDETKATPAYMGSLVPGQRVYVGFTAKNTGNMTWLNSGPHALMVGTASPAERKSLFNPGSNWLSITRPALMKEASVAPGETGTFEFWLTVPASGAVGVYNERFNLIANELTWLNDTGLSYYMNVQPAKYTWSVASQYAYTDDSKTTPAYMSSLMPGQRVYVGFTAKNTGNVPWLNSGAHALMVGTASPAERKSLFNTGSNWLSVTRPTLMKEASVAPGQTGTFEFWLTIPDSGVTGVYNERFNLIANELTWLNDTGLSYYMNVR